MKTQPEEGQPEPVEFSQALATEYSALGLDVIVPPEITEDAKRDLLFSAAHGSSPFRALCISGGGIRSATFALGAVQALATRGLLGDFHYLSTVSGGGYIGSWLSAWIQRVQGLKNVLPELLPNARVSKGPDPVQHLREYNNYLTPKLGAFSPDTWTLVAIVLRNMLLNWLVLIPLLMALMVVPRLLVSLLVFDIPGKPDPTDWWQTMLAGIFIAGCVSFCISLFNMFRYLPSVGNQVSSLKQFLLGCLLPLSLSAALLVLHFWWYYDSSTPLPEFWTLVLFVIGLSSISWLAYLIAFAGRRFLKMLFGPFSLAVLILGTATGAAAWVLTHQLYVLHDATKYATFGPPLLLGGAVLGAAIFSGFTSRILQDIDREWLSRAAAHLLLVMVAWTGLGFVGMLIPGFLHHLAGSVKASLGAAGGIAGWLTAMFGHSSGTSATTPSKDTLSKVKEFAAKLALPFFVVSLMVALAIFNNWALVTSGAIPGHWTNFPRVAEATPLHVALGLQIVLLLISVIAGRYININRFSLHAMYRFRLIRAYLAASNPDRHPDGFTGFDEGDNVPMASLRGQTPLHVVNVALNLVATKKLAWQQRKAESFSVSPWHSGCPHLGYRDSALYGGQITLGTAMTISGAAASPNMGYHSSPLVGFVMMLFNARLGWWLGNPGSAGEDTWRDEGPRSAVASVVKESMGLTNDTASYIYLSDGGHFENLGLYEMVRRRCRTIVVLDSGCDQRFTYEDLGNALRKIRIDLKIPIIFSDESMARLRAKQQRFAVGRIVYSAVDGPCEDGRILYLKPMMLGEEPPDVTSYQAAHPTFPHETTANQWFSEAQTESYRMMGFHTVMETLGAWRGTTLEDACDFLNASDLRAGSQGRG